MILAHRSKCGRLLSATLISLIPTLALAQTADTDTTNDRDEPNTSDIFVLSPFEVETSGDVGYRSTNSTSGTSLNVALRDLPMSVSVINKEFLNDFGATNLDESLEYAAGVFTSDNQASNSVGATRGNPGGGSGDRSISSAGGGSGARFANNVFIRGLATPYQNRLGFRYGGVVVTPNSSIALGGLVDSLNVERLEVVKGPNSLLYGVGVLTGIVNAIPERPLPEPRFEAGVSLGSYGFFRGEVDWTAPIKSEAIPGELAYRVAGSMEERDNWTDFRSEETEYWLAQIEYRPTDWMKVFLEYQDGNSRINGIGSQWIYDDLGDANDSEFRNEFGEGYNWARLDGTLPELRALDPNGYEAQANTINADGSTGINQAFRLLDQPFTGGSRPNGYRITGPDTFAERDEQNFLADFEFFPIENLTINVGGFWTQQETRELRLNTGGISVGGITNFVNQIIPGDDQLNAIWQSGGLYGLPLQQSIRDLVGISTTVNPDLHEGDYILPGLTDDIKATEYWWERHLVKSESQQYRVRATYTFESDFFFDTDAEHTILAGYSFLQDDVDFPDGSLNRGNARANSSRSWTFSGEVTDVFAEGTPVDRPFSNDGLYHRSIANVEPFYLDGRNDGVDGHNTLRAGDAYLNQVITQQGFYGVYHGKFFEDRLEIIAGLRRDIYNAEQFTYKRVNLSDDALRDAALAQLTGQVTREANALFGTDTPEAIAAIPQILADRTADESYIAAYYRNEIESGDQGYFGLANRGGPVDESYGIVPGSKFDIFAEDVEVTTGTFAFNYDITDDITLYGLLAQGISPNTALRDGAGEIIPAEETLNKEVGFKFEIFENKLSGSISYFQIDRENAIWDVDLAPSASKWLDAATNPNRSNEWTVPTYDPASPSTYFVLGDYLVDHLSEAFGIAEEDLSFGQQGTRLIQNVTRDDLPEGLSRGEAIALLQQINAETIFPESFASQWNGQQPFGGNVPVNLVGINAEGLDDLQEITLYDRSTGELVTRNISNLPILYAAFTDREIDKTKTDLFDQIHPIRYRRFDPSAQPQDNNNVDFDQSQGALVTFDEKIEGFEVELFYTPTDNLQIFLTYTHIDREAEDTFNFTDWTSTVSTEENFIPPFTMLHREYGWEAAGMQLVWADAAAYEAAASGGGVVAADNLSGLEFIPAEQTDATISPSEFISRNEAGQILLFVDNEGNIVNEANNVRATDYTNILSGVSLSFNPTDEAAIFGRYSFAGNDVFPWLDGLTATAGMKYIGPSETSVAFRSISPLNELTVTPEVGERFRFDFGLSYRWEWQNISWRLALNAYDAFNNTYEVTTVTLDQVNPITGRQEQRRTETFRSPTTYRIGLNASF